MTVNTATARYEGLGKEGRGAGACAGSLSAAGPPDSLPSGRG
jgi:hypothetical protein